MLDFTIVVWYFLLVYIVDCMYSTHLSYHTQSEM